MSALLMISIYLGTLSLASGPNSRDWSTTMGARLIHAKRRERRRRHANTRRAVSEAVAVALEARPLARRDLAGQPTRR